MKTCDSADLLDMSRNGPLTGSTVEPEVHGEAMPPSGRFTEQLRLGLREQLCGSSHLQIAVEMKGARQAF